MSIAVFSAQRFYQSATGLPVDSSHTHVSLDVEIPRSGAHLIDAAPDGSTHLAWLQGIVASSKQREHFIQDIELHRIPHPIAHSTNLAAVGRAHYLSLNELQSQSRTIASLLGLTDPLIDAASQSRSARCTRCEQFTPLFATPSELCDEIARSWREQTIEIELIGPSEAIASWAKEHGFHYRSHDQNLSAIRLDSFQCDKLRTLQLQPLIASTRKLNDTWLAVRSQAAHQEYAWNGRCSSCCYNMAPLQRSTARDLIERGVSEDSQVAGSRLLEGLSLSDLLTRPLKEVLTNDFVARLLSLQQRDAIQTLELADLALGNNTSTLTPRILAKVALVAHASLPKNHRDIIIFDVPRSLFSAREYDAVLSVAEKIGHNTPVVWLSASTPPTETISERTSRAEASSLGTLQIKGSSPISGEIQVGEWFSVPHTHDERLGPSLCKALLGSPSPLITFSAARPFTAHFVPLFSEDSSTTRLVAHQIGAIEPLAKMFAASHQAKMLGLSARDFLIGQIKRNSTLCGTCRGAGIFHAAHGDLWGEEIGPCPTCWGSRFRSPARDVPFKGKTLWEILNSSIASLEQTLHALPKMKEIFELTTLLGLNDIALGTPTALLHTTQRRMLAIIHTMLEATATKPSILVIEAPFVGLSGLQQAGLQQAAKHPRFKERVAWLGVEG